MLAIKKIYLLLFLQIACGYISFSQQYYPIPSNDASWRYRVYDLNNNLTIVTDQLLLVNGVDTIVNGKIYHQVVSRFFQQFGPENFDPPVLPETALYPDIFYTGIREENKKVYKLSGTGELLMYDFNAQVNDSIPSFSGKIKVVAIDSVLLDGAYHKRYLTTDTGFYVIEGVGASRGLIINLNDGSGFVQFYCFTNNSLVFSPRQDIPCTTIYPNSILTVNGITLSPERPVAYPSPFYDVLNIETVSQCRATLYNILGDALVNNIVIDKKYVLNTANYPRGVYFLKFSDTNNHPIYTLKLVK